MKAEGQGMNDLAARVIDLAVQIQQVPAPTFGEARRAEFIERLLRRERKGLKTHPSLTTPSAPPSSLVIAPPSSSAKGSPQVIIPRMRPLLSK